VHCKKADAVDVKAPIARYAAANFPPAVVADLDSDLSQLASLRTAATGLGGSLPDLRTALTAYYRALCAVETRFPVGAGAGAVDLTFAWSDAFRANKKSEGPSLHLEKAAILFNVGAALTQAALAADRAADAGLRDAAKKFQEAAGAFGALRDGPALALPPPRPVDVSPECAGMLERLCLAQAQELTYEKARLDGKQPAVLARLAAAAGELYGEVGGLLAAPPLASHFDKSWAVHAAVKAGLYAGEAGAASAAALHASDDIAPEIARLRGAQAALAPARAQAKACARELVDALAGLDARLGTALAQAERENATVYLQRVPALADLDAVAPARLVKPSLPPDLDAATDAATGLFAGVVPDSSAQALSHYTARVDDIVRSATAKLDAASDDARLKLREWDLPDCLAPLAGGAAGAAAGLPEGLRRELEAIQDAGGARSLDDAVASIKQARAAAEADLARAVGELDREAREDGDARSAHGDRWTRPLSSTAAAPLREKTAGYAANLAAAGESDARLAARLRDNAASFAGLAPAAAAAALPKLAPPLVTTAGDDSAATAATLRSALAAVDALSAERAAVEDALRAERSADNPLPKMLAGAPADALFAAELKKYDPLVARADESLAKQAELLATIATAKTAYARAYSLDAWRAECDAAAAGVRGRADAFKELRDNLGEGTRFYASLRDALAGLARQVTDYVTARRLERDDLVEALRRGGGGGGGGLGATFAALGFGGHAHPPPPPPPQPAYPPAAAAYYGVAPPQAQQAYGAPPPPPPGYAPSPYAAAWGAPPPAGAGAHPGVMPNYYAGTGYAPQAPQAPPPPPGDSASNPLWGVRR
jgi:programmed cell death 6-interacting protein